MMPDSVLLAEKLLFEGLYSEALFFEVGDFAKCLTLGQPDNLWKEKNSENISVIWHRSNVNVLNSYWASN